MNFLRESEGKGEIVHQVGERGWHPPVSSYRKHLLQKHTCKGITVICLRTLELWKKQVALKQTDFLIVKPGDFKVKTNIKEKINTISIP